MATVVTGENAYITVNGQKIEPIGKNMKQLKIEFVVAHDANGQAILNKVSVPVAHITAIQPRFGQEGSIIDVIDPEQNVHTRFYSVQTISDLLSTIE